MSNKDKPLSTFLGTIDNILKNLDESKVMTDEAARNIADNFKSYIDTLNPYVGSSSFTTIWEKINKTCEECLTNDSITSKQLKILKSASDHGKDKFDTAIAEYKGRTLEQYRNSRNGGIPR